MAEREARVAHTEALFRDVNERIAASADLPRWSGS